MWLVPLESGGGYCDMICLGTWGFRSHEEVGLDFTCNGLSLKAFKQGNDMIWFIFLKDYFGTWVEYG